MKTIRQTAYFNASPHEVFELLMDSKKHAGFSGSKAKISRKKNGAFEAYDGWIQGKNIKIVKDKKIVQFWRGKSWPKGHFSKAEFKFVKKRKGCKLTFTQTGVPDEVYSDINKGWKFHYWKKMKAYLEKHN